MSVNTAKEIVNKKQIDISIVSNLRGFAAVIVFLFHIVCVTNGYISNKILYQIFDYGKYGVQFFFVISGFVITYSMLKGNYTIKNFFTFLKKRIIRIEPPYLVMVALTILFLLIRSKWTYSNGNTELPTFVQILLHIGYLIPFSNYGWLSIVFWTLAIEFQFYIFFSLLFELYVQNKWIRWILQIILITTCFKIASEAFFFHWSPVFLLGINLALFKMKKMNAIELGVTSLLILTSIFFMLDWKVLIFSFIPFLLIYAEPTIKSKLWDFFGKISYSLYLCHTLIAFTIINLAIRFTHTLFHKIIWVSIAVLATLLFSYLLYYYVERPFKRIAAAIKYSN